MGEDKKPMPVDGSGSTDAERERNSDLGPRPDGPEQAGESGGGPYPNPHSGEDGGGFKGGQSGGSGYYGSGQLGDTRVGGNDNAVSDED